MRNTWEIHLQLSRWGWTAQPEKCFTVTQTQTSGCTNGPFQFFLMLFFHLECTKTCHTIAHQLFPPQTVWNWKCRIRPCCIKPYNLNTLLITSEVTLPSNGGYPTLPIKLLHQSSHPHSPGLVGKCTKFGFMYRFESKFQNCWKNQSDASEINGHQCCGQAWSDITFQRFKKISKLHFATPNEELKILKCVKVVEQVWNIKISRSEFNGTMIRITLDPIADAWGWFEISKWGNLCYGAFKSIEFTRRCQMFWLESIGMMTTIISVIIPIDSNHHIWHFL